MMTAEQEKQAEQNMIRVVNYICKYQTTQTMNSDVTINRAHWEQTAKKYIELELSTADPPIDVALVSNNYFEHCIGPYAEIKRQAGYRSLVFLFRRLSLALQCIIAISVWTLIAFILFKVLISPLYPDINHGIYVTIVSSIGVVIFPLIVRNP